MDQAALGSSSLSTATGGLHASARSVTTNPSVQQSSSNPRQPRSDLDGDNLSEPSTKTGSEIPAASASSHAMDCRAGRASKRIRTDIGDADISPVRKKIARNPRVDVVMSVTKSPPQAKAPTNMSNDNQDASESDESPVRPEIQATATPAELVAPTHKSKPESTTAPMKPITIAGRCRACDTCRRRKVKCKHKIAEEGIDDNANFKRKTTPKNSTAKTSKRRKRVQTDGSDGPASLGAAAPNAEAQGGQMDDANDHGQEVEEEVPKETKAKKRAAPKKAEAPPARISTRNRNAPERFGDLEEHPSAKATPLKKTTKRVFDPVYITTNSTSRLGKADMHRMLLSDAAWTSLSAEQQVTLVSMLPNTSEHQQLITRIEAGETEDTRPWAFTLSNDCFRTDVAKFKEDLKNGHLAKTWQAAAEQAVIERAAGEYDAWKAEEAELWWGQKGK
ncbi:hypothetical protein ST47_g43 [Ascochyta rabiei]|uniref:Uncharacterized protein n=2 Tax=Didymella rabiei TaxID=5454 RepID=A0A163MLS1_DIDRA|nr:hypothetical protein ST47_g43 [Ascochyta rabiei]